MEKYSHVRFRWWNPVDLEKASMELSAYEPKMTEYAKEGFGLYRDDKQELVAKADTLVAHLGRFRAVISQTEAKPFTRRDVDLRERVREIYPQDRPTPFPWQWTPEPKYRVE